MVKESEFFKEKKAYSKIKDHVLGYYLVPYLSKVATLKRPIILVDAFAGPGRYEDGESGSPLIIQKAAEEHAKGRYKAIFINKKRASHITLSEILKKLNNDALVAIHGKSEIVLQEISKTLTNETIFIYLDPFGGCKFEIIKPFLERDRSYSTEVVINISVPILHRLAGNPNSSAQWHETLSSLLNGDYWKDILWDNNLDTEQKEQKLIKNYQSQLKKYLSYTGSCPVRAKPGQRIKYFVTFCSRHEHSFPLMNDAMCNAYERAMYSAILSQQPPDQITLFEPAKWEEIHRRKVDRELEEVIIKQIKGQPGLTRYQYWLQIISIEFMNFLKSEYIRKIKELFDKGIIDSSNPRQTSKLNDDCRLFLKGSPYANN